MIDQLLVEVLDSKTGLLTDKTEKHRISSLDLVRGMVMIIMALDHTRDMTHIEYWDYAPEDLTQTSPAIFLTRWITHFCAPTFVFLSGTSAYLAGIRKEKKKDLAFFLLTRGVWLMILEVTVVRFGILFNLFYDFAIFQVIWAIGICMVCMAGIVFLPFRLILILGLAIVFGHNLLSPIMLKPDDPFYTPWVLLHQPSSLQYAPGKVLFVAYPFLAWLGVMMTGYCFGRLFEPSFEWKKRKSILVKTGMGAVGLFLLLRGFNIYGDPNEWSEQKSVVFTLLSFLNTTKYPPSLLFILMTLGPVILLLSLLEDINLKALKPIIVYGRVPLFYYLIHWYLIHTIALTLALITTGKSFSDLTFRFGQNNFGGIPSGTGFALPGVYLIWITVVVLLYPLCNWYNNYKSRNKKWWLSYL